MIQGLVDWLVPEHQETDLGEPLSAALERVRHAVRPGSLVVVISDFFGMDEACNRHLSRLRQHNDVIGCQVVDAAEYRLPQGRYPISDGENTAVLDMGQKESRSRYDQMSSAHLDVPRRMFQKHQCGWLVLHTDDDPVDVLGHELRVLVGRPV
jgi:hypothetical protein